VKTACVVTSYNYRAYLDEAIQSALGQTRPFDVIVVVDDASTDGSPQWLRDTYGSHERVRLVLRESNGGQLAAFYSGIDATEGDIVFFLDADDVFEPEYVERAVSAHSLEPAADMVIVANRKFGNRDEIDRPWPVDRDIGISRLRTYHHRRWLGGPTSTLSLRRTLLDTLRPLAREDDWRNCADAFLSNGASLVGGYTRYVAAPLVRYRVHESNNFYGKPMPVLERHAAVEAFVRLAHLAQQRTELDFEHLASWLHREFETIPAPDRRDLSDYLRIAMKSSRVAKSRLRVIVAVLRHYARHRAT